MCVFPYDLTLSALCTEMSVPRFSESSLSPTLTPFADQKGSSGHSNYSCVLQSHATLESKKRNKKWKRNVIV